MWVCPITKPGSPLSSPGLQSPGRVPRELFKARSNSDWNVWGGAVGSSISQSPPRVVFERLFPSIAKPVRVFISPGFYLAWHT